MIAWRDELNIGVDAVDKQHQELVRMLNDFLEACTQQKGKEKLEETLDFLISYTVKHFNDEEALMKGAGYPHYIEHKAEHDQFVKEVAAIQQQLKEKGASVLTTIKLNRALVDWLINHIQKNDQQMGEYLKAKKA
ncbi:bacteriohemerythrin [Gorillibacterium timonense]|uniref:bacteriohemerythrin n=1 Tax=Gorillibacterium timonense TaxID=1689269 RepID=UPI000B18AFFF|nr:bacteriohemerythrin [Gorillibacterium timonense]